MLCDQIIFMLGAANNVNAADVKLQKDFINDFAIHVNYHICKYLKFRYTLFVFENQYIHSYKLLILVSCRGKLDHINFSHGVKDISGTLNYLLTHMRTYSGKRRTIIFVAFGEPSDKEALEFQTKEAINRGMSYIYLL